MSERNEQPKPVRRRRKKADEGEDRLVKFQKEQPPVPRDPSGKWRSKVNELADRLGWQRAALWSLYDESACLIEYELKISRPLAESAGFRLLRGLVDKTELAAEMC